MKDKKYIIIITSLVIVILIGSIFILNKDDKKRVLDDKSTPSSSKTTTLPNSEVISDISDFDYHFIKLENNNNNMVYSPLSIKYALFMAREGADGNTLKELDKLLGNSKLHTYKNVKDHISLANAIFVRDSYKDRIKKTYINNISKKYNAEVKYDEFKNANNINKWINNNTLGLINNMLNDSDVNDPSRRLILVNALALKLNFKEPFGSISKDKFYNGDKTSNIKMMNLITDSKSNKYYIDDNITVLRKDLEKQGDYEFELIAIEPKDDLSKYINNFSSKELESILKKTKSVSDKEELKIKLPKFAYEYDLNLKADLMSLGVKDMFNARADFSKLAKDDLYISDALHKALIDVDENGIKAAAVTVLSYDLTYMPEPKESIDLIFDHPFMYLIRNKSNGDIWFVGTVYEPELYEE